MDDRVLASALSTQVDPRTQRAGGSSTRVAEKASQNALFNFARLAIATSTSLIVSITIARILGPNKMGTYTYLIWIAGVLTAFSSLGLPETIVKYVAEHSGRGEPRKAGGIARALLIVQVVAAAIVALFACAMWAVWKHEYTAITVLITCAMVVPMAVQEGCVAILHASQRFDIVCWSALAGSFTQVALVLSAALLSRSLESFLVAVLVATMVSGCMNYWSCRPMLHGDDGVLRLDREGIRQAKSFAFDVYCLWLLNLVVWDRIEFAFLKHYSLVSAVAFYGMSFALAGRLSGVAESMTSLVFPMCAESFGQTGTNGVRNIFRNSVMYVQAVMVPLCFGAIAVAPRLIVLAYGREYEPRIPALRILLITLPVTLLANVGVSVLYALGKQRLLVLWMIAVAALDLALDVLLIPRYGATGAAIANGGAQVVVVVGILFYVLRLMPCSFPWAETGKVYVATAIVCIPVAYGSASQAPLPVLLVTGVAAIVGYTVILVASGVVSKDAYLILTRGVLRSGTTQPPYGP